MAWIRILMVACLCALALTLRADDHRDVGLNHFYAVLDEQTFAALRDSQWLRTQLAAVDTGLPNFTPPQTESQRIYVRGRKTYIEFLGPQNPFKEPVGKIGIALGIDQLSLLDSVQRSWSEKLGSAAERYQVEWKKANPSVPWYDVVQHASTANNPHVVLWVSAYRPEFLPWLYPQQANHATGTRAEFLAPQFRQDRLLQDVTGLVVALPEPLRRQIAKQLVAIGYRQLEQADGLQLQNDEWALTLLESNGQRAGLCAIAMATNRDVAGLAEVRLSPRSKITFGARNIATWTFAEVQ